MSEYQYYEFMAIDRPLTEHEQAAVRSMSSRARITATSFVNEYHWGDFKGDPNRLMEHYYDAHLYMANWGTRRAMIRLPTELLCPDTVEDYCVDDQFVSWVSGEFILIDLTSEDDTGEFDFEDEPDAMLPAIIGVRAELAAGDLRPLYIAWLAGRGALERDEADDDLEPPVPAGLGTPTAAQRALADFLRLDEDLLAVAAHASPPIEEFANDPSELADWASRLAVHEKDRLLQKVVQGKAARVGVEMLRRFRDETAPITAARTRRTVADLLDQAAR